MEYISVLFSLLFILGALLPIFWGLHIIRLNRKSTINRVFLLLAFALSIWSFGFLIANLATNLDIAMFWRRFASVGMISLYSFVIHFFLLLTRQDEDKKLNQIVYMLYIPALILIYIFTVSPSGAINQYDLVRTAYGLTNIAQNTLWNYFYYAYFSLYMFLSIGIVWKWKQRLQETSRSRQADVIIGTIIASGILATLTDILTTTFLSTPLPQMAPLFILMPVWAMYHSARYYGMMNLSKNHQVEIIVTEQDRKQIFNNIAIAFYLGAILSFAAEYIPYMNTEDAFQLSLLKSLTLVGIGISINLSQKIKKESIQENLTIFFLVTSIPLGMLQYVRYGSITVWAFPVVIIISSIIFSKLTLLISTTVVAILTQFVIWGIYPEVTVVVDKYDYILRIGIFIVAFLIGLYINRMYVTKIKENNIQIAFQEMVSEVLFDFVNVNQENYEDKVNDMLEKVGVFFNVDRIYLFTIDQHNQTMTYSNEWCNTEITEELGTIKDVPLTTFAWWVDQLNKNKLVYIKDVDLMPAEANSEHEQLLKQGVQSLVSVPVIGDGEMLGFIGIDAVLGKRNWSEENIEMLTIMANILYGGLMQIEADAEIEFMAYYDNLTNLPNRFLFEDRVKQAIYLSKRTGKYIAVLFIDLDNFKTVNDTIGHRGGDDLLKQVAKGLSETVRKTDTVARFGGDEFMIMIDNISDYSIITDISDKIMQIFADLFMVEGQEFLVTASAGIALYPIDGEDTNTLIKNADIAMYEAKAKGRNQYALCTRSIKDEVQKNMELSNDLYYALEKDEFFVHYQPQIDLATNTIRGVEALLRWDHPTRGVIAPDIFIPIAEETGLINSIGEWVLRTAARQNKKWQDMGLPPMAMAVNLSAVQVINPRIVENIEKIITETGLAPEYIELEITESIAIEEADYVVDILNDLKKVGVSIAIDDFGTKYSSLSRLKMLPIDRIKIDMQFIQGIEVNEKDRAITMVIIKLAKSLGINVLAEGVETAPQLEYLNQEMCESTQGFYHYKPMSADKIEETLKSYI